MTNKVKPDPDEFKHIKDTTDDDSKENVKELDKEEEKLQI